MLGRILLLLISSLAVFITTILFEFGLILMNSNTVSNTSAYQLNEINKLRANDIDAYPDINASLFLNNSLKIPILYNKKIIPLSAINNSMTVFCAESGKQINYLSDKFGFRNSQEIYSKNIEIILLGDSFTQGHCVEDSLNIAGQIRKNYPIDQRHFYFFLQSLSK